MSLDLWCVSVVDDKSKDHAVLCQWIESGEGGALRLDQTTVEVGRLPAMANTYGYQPHKDMAE